MDTMKNTSPHGLYSVYYNAMPIYEARVDPTGLKPVGGESFDSWMKGLLQLRATPWVGRAEGLVADRMRHLYFETRNFEKNRGGRVLGLGFPMLIDTNETDLVFAPLFIWSVTVEPAMKSPDTWVLKPLRVAPQPNRKLFRHLRNKYDLDLLEQASALLESPSNLEANISALCEQIIGQIHFSTLEKDELRPCPGIDKIGDYSKHGAIVWCAVLALFPPQRWYQPASLPPPEELLVPTRLTEASMELPFAFQLVSPPEAAIQDEMSYQKLLVVETRMNKSHLRLLVNHLIACLVNGHRVLVVSHSVPALGYLQRRLSDAGFLKHHYLLDDPVQNAEAFLQLLRSAYGAMKAPIIDRNQIMAAKNTWMRTRDHFDKACASARKKIFGHYSWTEATGLFLLHNRKAGKELLSAQLNPKDFQFSYEEYSRILESVKSCSELFPGINTLNHPLNLLHPDLYLHTSSEQAYRRISSQLSSFQRRAESLQRAYVKLLDRYTAYLRNHFDTRYVALRTSANQLLERIQSKAETLGKDFSSSRGRSSPVLRLFSTKRKQIEKAQKEVARHYEQLIDEFASEILFEFSFPDCNRGYHIKCVNEAVSGFLESLERWYANIETLVQDEVLRLNHKTVLGSFERAEEVKALEQRLDEFLDALNEARLFADRFENKTLTLQQRLRYLENLLDTLETTQVGLRDFEKFYSWQQGWLRAGGKGQKVIRALVKAKPSDWIAAFHSWYLYQVLLKNQSPDLPTSQQFIDQAAEAWAMLKPYLPNWIDNIWYEQQLETTKALKRKDGRFFKRIFISGTRSKSPEPTLREVFEKAFQAITSFFPILFVTPHVAWNVLHPSGGRFKYAILDEANMCTIEEATLIATMADHMLFCGSRLSQSDETGAMDYVIENDVPLFSIPQTGWLSEKGPFHLAKGLDTRRHYRVIRVDGRFDELDAVNDLEAQHVVSMLNQVKYTERRVYPSIGIVTMTVEQRDRILSYLLKIKMENNQASEKIHQLERNGMAVLHVGELWGAHFDVLYVSCTFGINTKESITRKVALLNKPETQSALKYLIAMNAREMVLVHSLPQQFLLTGQRMDPTEGVGLLTRLIGLAEAREQGNDQGATALLKDLGLEVEDDPFDSVFLDETRNALEAYFDKGRFAQAKAGRGMHPSLLLRATMPSACPSILQPDLLFASGETSHAPWEKMIREELQRKGYPIMPLWSINWFRDAEQEARRLASQVLKWDEKIKATSREDASEHSKEQNR